MLRVHTFSRELLSSFDDDKIIINSRDAVISRTLPEFDSFAVEDMLNIYRVEKRTSNHSLKDTKSCY